MTNAQRVEALRKAGVDGVAFVRFTHEMSQWEPEHFVSDVHRRVAAPRRGLGRRQLPVRPRPLRQLLAAAVARPALRLPGRADRPGPLPRLRGQQHPGPPAGHRRPGRRGGGAARALPLRRRHGGRRGRPRPIDRHPDRQPGHRERAAAAPGRLRHRGHHRPHRAPRHHQHRRPAHLRDGRGVDDRDPHLRPRRGPLRPRPAARPSCCGCGPNRRSRTRRRWSPRSARTASRRRPCSIACPPDGGIARRLDTIARMSGTSQGFGEHGAFTVSVAGDPRLIETVHELTRKTAEIERLQRRRRRRPGRRRVGRRDARWPTTSTWPTGPPLTPSSSKCDRPRRGEGGRSLHTVLSSGDAFAKVKALVPAAELQGAGVDECCFLTCPRAATPPAHAAPPA